MDVIETAADPCVAFGPPLEPVTLEDAGLSLDLVTQLVLKRLHFAGEQTGVDLAASIGLNFAVIQPSLERLRLDRQSEIAGGGVMGPPSYRYRITDSGRARSGLFLEHNHYVGVAPVPLHQYRVYMEQFERSIPRDITRERVRQAFAHLVLSDRVLDQIGPAVTAKHSMFVYGPPGNGKTVISQAISRLLDGEIAIPHAIEVEGNIIRLFDPVNHQQVSPWTLNHQTPLSSGGAGPEGNAARPALGHRHDGRWVRCRRPLVTVGGELTLAALDLNYNPSLGFYRAPIQALANGGVLVIDDFGRQQGSPRDFLNRWIVPLESRVDYLRLQTGLTFELPFQVFVVFATNIKPAALVDEAFLRRIRYKVYAENPTVDEFARIFEHCCADRGVAFERVLVDQLLRDCYQPRKIALRGCQPRDLIDQALSLAAYLGQPRRLTPDLLEAACASYFIDDNESPALKA